MTDTTLVVRPLTTDAEIATYFTLAASTFPGYHATHCTPTPGGNLAAGWRRFVEDAPGFESVHLRGAFSGDAFLGGYQHDERTLLVDGTPLRSGYIGGVVTDPAHRGRGVASALMRNSVAVACERQQALLVLRGIPDFYGRFGFADVMEVTEHAVEVGRIMAMRSTGFEIRPANLDDAALLLALYEYNYGACTGSYARTLALQEHLIRHRTRPPLLAIDPNGVAHGYLLLPGGQSGSGAVEAAADTWPAALALLQFQGSGVKDEAEIRWPLPSNSPTYYHLASQVSVRSETRSRPNAGWMARPGHLGALFEGLVPLWRRRWSRARTNWSDVLAFEVGDPEDDLVLGHAPMEGSLPGAQASRPPIPTPGGQDARAPRESTHHSREDTTLVGREANTHYLELTSNNVRLVDEQPGAHVVRLSFADLTQLIFGYRPAGWMSAAESTLLPLEVLFPPGVPWYPASNRC
jgi:predicted acetyltransferase